MRRAVTNTLTLMSAVICVGSALLVGRSFFRSDKVYIPLSESHEVFLFTIDGQLWTFHNAHRPRPGEPYYIAGPEYRSMSNRSRRTFVDRIEHFVVGVRRLGIGWGQTYESYCIILPLWLLPIVTAILPVWWLIRRRRNSGRGFEVERVTANANDLDG